MTLLAAEMLSPTHQNRDLTISVVILSYNYADFLGPAIDSALALDWPRVEVIVVDDGSTDESPDVVRSYGAQVIPVFKENGGHLSAYAAGFARTTGEVIFFLDADDLLDPSIVREVAKVWRPGISKVQFQMRIINARGEFQNQYLPQYFMEPSSQDIRRWVIAASAYPTPPGSGNAYSRAFLARIFPLPEWFHDNAGDSACLSAAPILGDIVTVPKPLVAYRVHGRNQAAMLGLDVGRLGTEVNRAHNRFAYSKSLAESVGIVFSDQVLRKSLAVLPYRVASWRLAGFQHPYFRDNTARLMVDVVRGAVTPQGVDFKTRTVLVAWTFLVLLSPKRVAWALTAWRFVPASRPQTLSRFLRRIGIAR